MTTATAKFVFLAVILGAMSGGICSKPSYAQEPADEVESLYDRFEDKEEKESQSRQEAKKSQKTIKPSHISDLAQLSPFEDIAVIQRRFLPKTNRFEASLVGTIATNNAFVNMNGAALKAAYFFKEKYGLEFTYMFINSQERTITENLLNVQQIQTSSFVEPKNYMGLSFKWSPIYGKVAWLDNRIVPFDIYFTPGFGMTKTALGKSEMTASLGFGQNFGLSKNWAIRWDFNWNFYQATVINQTTSLEENKFHSDLFLSLGASWYFPEADYR